MENVKNFITSHAGVIAICIVVGLLCLAYIFNNGGTATDLGSQLDAVGEQQQSAIESVERIESGLDTATAGAESVGAGIDRAAESAERVQEANRAAQESATDIESRITASQDITADSAERIRESKSICSEIRKQAETD